jgi:nicotinate dehydrogenase subunit A
VLGRPLPDGDECDFVPAFPTPPNLSEDGMTGAIDLTLNGKPARVEGEAGATLLEALRGDLGLMGARYGCGLGQCGACTVLVDGRPANACAVEAASVAGKSVTTVEGLGTLERPHPLQTAFLELQAGQCGYCLSGILVSAKALLDANPDPSRAEVATALNGHLCRCGVHNRILDAVALAASRLREGVAA